MGRATPAAPPSTRLPNTPLQVAVASPETAGAADEAPEDKQSRMGMQFLHYVLPGWKGFGKTLVGGGLCRAMLAFCLEARLCKNALAFEGPFVAEIPIVTFRTVLWKSPKS